VNQRLVVQVRPFRDPDGAHFVGVGGDINTHIELRPLHVLFIMLRPQDLWSTLLICGPIFLTLALVIRWVRNYYHLCNIPGPLLAQFSDAWRIWHCWTGQSSQQYKLHRQYDSPLIRLGPNTVSVSDARSMPAIYGLKPILNKVSVVVVLAAGTWRL